MVHGSNPCAPTLPRALVLSFLEKDEGLAIFTFGISVDTIVANDFLKGGKEKFVKFAGCGGKRWGVGIRVLWVHKKNGKQKPASFECRSSFADIVDATLGAYRTEASVLKNPIKRTIRHGLTSEEVAKNVGFIVHGGKCGGRSKRGWGNIHPDHRALFFLGDRANVMSTAAAWNKDAATHRGRRKPRNESRVGETFIPRRVARAVAGFPLRGGASVCQRRCRIGIFGNVHE